jgi:hypothetical protein
MARKQSSIVQKVVPFPNAGEGSLYSQRGYMGGPALRHGRRGAHHMGYDDGAGEPIHTVRMRRMMAFVRGLIDTSGYSLGQIAQLATALAERDGCKAQVNAAFVGRLGGQGSWYTSTADDFFYMRVYFTLRALDSSMGDLERAMEHVSEVGAAEEALLVRAFRRIQNPALRDWASSTIRDAANVDASLPRERSPYVMPGPFRPPVASAIPNAIPGDAPEGDASEGQDRPTLEQLGRAQLGELDRQDAERRARKRGAQEERASPAQDRSGETPATGNGNS